MRPADLPEPEILYSDNHCLAVGKPPRMLTMGDRTGETSLADVCTGWIRRTYHKPGNVFLGVVHRLDRPVSGVVLFARTSKAAARLSEQFRSRRVTKVYEAIVDGRAAPGEVELTDWLVKDRERNVVRTADPAHPGAQQCVLTCRTVRAGRRSLLEIRPLTGRSHQIRVQLAARGLPICGDVKYGSPTRLEGAIALHAASLSFEHPTRREPVTVTAPRPAFWDELSDSA